MPNFLVLATAWGPKFGGINAFNVDFATGLASALGNDGRVFCCVLEASDAEIAEAKSSANVDLFQLGKDASLGRFDPSWVPELLAQVTDRYPDAKIDCWLGHDIVSSAAAIHGASLEVHSRSAVIMHMNYEAYQSIKTLVGQRAKDKFREQKHAMSGANHYFAVGPLLTGALIDMFQHPVTQLVPGFAKLEPKPTSAELTLVTFGRMDRENDRIKQGSLSVAGFGSAIRFAHTNPTPPAALLNRPRLNVIGIDEPGSAEERELRKLANKHADRVVTVIAQQFDTDRSRLLDEVSRANIAMMLSWHEGFGLTAWEAIAGAIPLIINRNTGVWHLITSVLDEDRAATYVQLVDVRGREDGEEEDNFADEDVVAVRDAILKIANDLGKAQRNALELRSILQSAFVCTWHHTADTFLQKTDEKLIQQRRAATSTLGSSTNNMSAEAVMNGLLEHLDQRISRRIIPASIWPSEYQIVQNELQLARVERPKDPQTSAVKFNGREPIDWSEIQKEIQTHERSFLVVSGEAGAGKSTFFRSLTKKIAFSARKKIKQGSTSRLCIPVYLELASEALTHSLIQAVNTGLPVGLELKDVEEKDWKLAIFLDGWNEIDASLQKQLLPEIKKIQLSGRHSIILSTRPNFNSAAFLSFDPKILSFETWSDDQAEEFFELNGGYSLWASMQKKAREVCSIPLVSFAALCGVAKSSNSKREIVNEYGFYEAFIEATYATYSEQIEDSVLLSQRLSELALRMTEQSSTFLPLDTAVQCSQLSLESIRALVDMGLLRYGEPYVALASPLKGSDKAKIQIGFRHQSFQDFFVVQALAAADEWMLPDNPSTSAFWRDIPCLMMQREQSQSSQEDLFERTLGLDLTVNDSFPDYYTAARLLPYLSDWRAAKRYRSLLLSEMSKEIRCRNVYPLAIETFSSLGADGADQLIGELQLELFERVYARAERHLVEEESDGGPFEEEWRALARSIYILGELNNPRLVDHLIEVEKAIKSIHLQYHIGEALLGLVRSLGLTDTDTPDLLKAISLLNRNDPVAAGYAVVVKRELGHSGNEIGIKEAIKAMVLRQSPSGDDVHYYEEFWRRAHGVEVFCELTDIDEALEVLLKLFKSESKLRYSKTGDGDYVAVHSSIMKALYRLCERFGPPDERWFELLDTILFSPRMAENSWACRHLQNILVRWVGVSPGLKEFLGSCLGNQSLPTETETLLRESLDFSF